MKRRLRLAASALSFVALLGACGSTKASDTETVTAEVTTPSAETAAAAAEPGVTAALTKETGRTDLRPESANGPLAQVIVDDLQGGGKVQFANLLPSDKPVLLWLWAPH
jgi:ABC-type glycerol-3-phosphate transport system substrate-binding protein